MDINSYYTFGYTSGFANVTKITIGIEVHTRYNATSVNTQSGNIIYTKQPDGNWKMSGSTVTIYNGNTVYGVGGFIVNADVANSNQAYAYITSITVE